MVQAPHCEHGQPERGIFCAQCKKTRRKKSLNKKKNHYIELSALLSIASAIFAILLALAYNECDDKGLRIMELEAENKFYVETIGTAKKEYTVNGAEIALSCVGDELAEHGFNLKGERALECINSKLKDIGVFKDNKTNT